MQKLTRMPDFGTGRLLLCLFLIIGSSSGRLIARDGDAGLTGEQPPAVSLAFDLQPIFDTYCVQCHLLESAQGGLVLENGEAWTNLVNTDSTQAPLKRVNPGIPAKSYLLNKLRGTHIPVGGSGQPMPYGSEASAGISVNSVELVERWISEGAADN